MNSTASRLAVLSILLNLFAPAAASAEPTRFVGARVSCDVPISSGDADIGACPGVEVFGRLALTPTVSLDGSIGYRNASYSYRGSSFYSWSLTQYPLLVGASYAPFPRASIRPSAFAGVLLAPYKASHSRSSSASSKTALSVGAFAGIGIQASLGRLMHLEAGLRYVISSIDADPAVHALERYPVAFLGLSRAF